MHFWFNQLVIYRLLNYNSEVYSVRNQKGSGATQVEHCVSVFRRIYQESLFNSVLLRSALVTLIDWAAPVLHWHCLLGSSAQLMEHQRLLVRLADSKHPIFHAFAHITPYVPSARPRIRPNRRHIPGSDGNPLTLKLFSLLSTLVHFASSTSVYQICSSRLPLFHARPPSSLLFLRSRQLFVFARLFRPPWASPCQDFL